MHSLLKSGLLLLFVLALGPVSAAPPAPSHSAAPATAPVTAPLPDYGGRESTPVVVDEAAPSPLAQMGRATEALVIVLAGIVGVVYALKRFGLVKPGENGKPAKLALENFGAFRRNRGDEAPGGDSPVTVLSSQTLPGGAMLHVVSIAGKNLLLGVTPQSVSTLTEWPAAAGMSADEAASFEEYLTRADSSPTVGSSLAAANARLRSLMGRPPTEENL